MIFNNQHLQENSKRIFQLRIWNDKDMIEYFRVNYRRLLSIVDRKSVNRLVYRENDEQDIQRTVMSTLNQKEEILWSH